MRRTVLLLVALVTGCGSAAPPPSTGGTDGPSGTVVVFAAASLTEVFEQVAADLEAEHPALDVVLSFGGSSGLAQQIVSGAPVDVFAAASPAAMGVVREAGGALEAEVFARNVLELVMPAGNPGRVRGLADLARDDLTVALCAPQVPCGAAAQQALAASGVEPAPDTLEQDVKAVLAKVVLDEADAGLVYRTDVRAAGDAVEGLAFPEAAGAANDYPVAVLTEAPNPDAAAVFVRAVLGPQGQRALDDAGFDRP